MCLEGSETWKSARIAFVRKVKKTCSNALQVRLRVMTTKKRLEELTFQQGRDQSI